MGVLKTILLTLDNRKSPLMGSWQPLITLGNRSGVPCSAQKRKNTRRAEGRGMWRILHSHLNDIQKNMTYFFLLWCLILSLRTSHYCSPGERGQRILEYYMIFRGEGRKESQSSSLPEYKGRGTIENWLPMREGDHWITKEPLRE